jgi:ABC-type phosphate transport system substrate-binding protein
LNTTTYAGLGYGTGTTCTTQQGTSILSPWSTSTANPVNYNIKGTDPITGQTIKAFTTIDVGATPVVFIVNRTNASGMGYPSQSTPSIVDLTEADAKALWSGAECDTNSFAGSTLNIVPPTDVSISVMQREPMSGTMNTTEFTTFRCGTSAAGNYTGAQCQITGDTAAGKDNTQEKGINPALGGTAYPSTTPPSNNPLYLPCTAGANGTPGYRLRAIGTGEMVGTAVLKTTDSIGYTFWGFGNVSKIAGNPDYGYLTLDGIDPIQSSYSTGELPVCVSSTGVSGVCPAPAGSTFPNLRNGTYKAWSMLRVITNASGVALTNTVLLVNAIQNNVNTTVPDFVPYGSVGGDPGMQYYRSHFTQEGYGPNNGLSAEKETGGDMGGCIEPVTSAPGVTGCHQ